MFHLKTVPLVGQFENLIGTYSIFLQHIQQPLIWLVCMDPQLPEEVFEMMNFVADLILVDLSSKQQISSLLAISALHDKHNPCFHTSDGHRVDISRQKGDISRQNLGTAVLEKQVGIWRVGVML